VKTLLRLATLAGRNALPVLLSLSSLGSAVAGECLKGTREVDLGEGKVAARSYLCETDSGAAVRIEIHRLSEQAAGDILSGRTSPLTEKVLGRPRLVENAVFEEARLLFDRYGVTETTVHTGEFNQDVLVRLVTPDPAAGRTETLRTLSGGGQEVTYLTLDDPRSGTVTFPLPMEDRAARKGEPWHRDFGFHYSPYGNQCTDIVPKGAHPIHCIAFWRYLDRRDVSGALNAIEDRRAGQPSSASYRLHEERLLGLLLHIGRERWPEELAVGVGDFGSPDACRTPGFSFSYYPRPMILDVLTIENLGDDTVSVDRLLGAVQSSSGLRPADESAVLQTAETVEISDGPAPIAPGESLLIPVKMTFVVQDALREAFVDASTAEANFRAIRSVPPDRVFELDFAWEPYADEMFFDEWRAEQSYWIKTLRTRDDFKPPQTPKMSNLVYGPEIAVHGLQVSGETMDLSGAAANYFEQLTASSGIGSCPYLYAWDETRQDWVRYRKVIHDAYAEELESTDTVELAGSAMRFRLVERELERSYIDKVSLDLRLEDGRTLTLEPDVPALGAADGEYARIEAGEARELSFTLPDGVERGQIRESSLSVTGYYERYGNLALSSPGTEGDALRHGARDETSGTSVRPLPVDPADDP
jgi:hypothetical protein